MWYVCGDSVSICVYEPLFLEVKKNLQYNLEQETQMNAE